MKRLFPGMLLMWMVLFTVTVRPDAEVHEWIGRYNMNHDGFVGTLSIEDSKRDCATSRWCHLVLKYTVPFRQMCFTMDGMSIFIVKHICRRDTT